MHQIKLSFDNVDSGQPLYIKTTSGAYEVATPAEVLAAARKAADCLAIKGEAFTSPNQVKNFVVAKLAGLEHEVFGVIFNDNQNHLIEYKEMFSGSVSSASVYPREVVKTALRLNASNVIFVHNHPSHSLSPSDADEQLTKRLISALELVEIRVLDHIIVAGSKTTSFAENGLI